MEDPAVSLSADDSAPNAQIQQKVESDGNQVIADFSGGNAFNKVDGNVFIYNYNNYYREDLQIPIGVAESAEIDQLPCPYRGLSNFEPGDSKYFFGRESFVEELLQATQTRKFIPLLGSSGSGKSSVVFAGLVPKLQKTGCWQFTYFRPDADPFYALAEALVPLYRSELDSTDNLTQAGKLSEDLKNGTTTLARVFSSIQRKHPNNRVLLIADQFEQLYTLCADETTRHNFLDKLLAGIFSSTDKTPFAPVLVATMRADFFSTAILYSPFADVLQNANLILKTMNRSELTEIIEKPAQMLGVTFEEGLVKRILEDVDKEPGILPLLEFALTELWKRRSNKQLTHAAYGEIGEVQGALDLRANQEYAKFIEVDQERVRRIFIQLVRPGEGAEDTRRVAMKEELGAESWSLVKRLADKRLVVTSRNASGQEAVEVVHEALIRNWGELRGWMEVDRVFRAWQERLRGAMRQWQETKQDEGSLLRGVALAEAEEQLQNRLEELAAESEFIELSRREQERIQKTEIKRKERVRKSELEQEERLRKAEIDRRKRKTVIHMVIIVSLLAALGVTSMFIYLDWENKKMYQKYAYCPTEKGRPGEKIGKPEETVCFRNIITSGEANIFLSSTNYYLDQGVKAFKKENDKKESIKRDYTKATDLFKQAIDVDFRDPVPQIFWQNAKARTRSEKLKSKGLKSTILKIAVVTSIDYYEKVANDVLRGVADSQEKFNYDQEKGDEKPLLEIAIANDENQPAAAKQIAELLTRNEGIMGVIGHHASESTIEAQKTYMKNDMPIISPTSSSSEIIGHQFFRTVNDTKKSAKKYVSYIRKTLKKSKVVIIYTSESEYSKAINKDFSEIFVNPKEEILDSIDIKLEPNITARINKIIKEKKGDVLLIFTSVLKNSVAIEINKNIYIHNKNIKPDLKIQVLGNMALSEQETIEKGGKYVNGMTVVRPCLSWKSPYIKNANEKWFQGKMTTNWRHASSYDSTQAFIKAIKMASNSSSQGDEKITRDKILKQLQSPLFSMAKNETSFGTELKWRKGGNSNDNGEYCIAQIENGIFIDID